MEISVNLLDVECLLNICRKHFSTIIKGLMNEVVFRPCVILRDLRQLGHSEHPLLIFQELSHILLDLILLHALSRENAPLDQDVLLRVPGEPSPEELNSGVSIDGARHWGDSV